MSLRDQLLAKGLVSKKKAKQVDRDLKKQRKKEQAQRKRKSQLEREAKEKAKQAEAALLAEKVAARKAREAVEQVTEHAHRVRQLILGNRLGARGRSRFFHKTLGKAITFVDVPEGIARQLRLGTAGIAALKEGDTARYFVITAAGASKLAEVEPSVLVHWVTDTSGLSDPAEQLFPAREWDTSLTPHRVR